MVFDWRRRCVLSVVVVVVVLVDVEVDVFVCSGCFLLGRVVVVDALQKTIEH